MHGPYQLGISWLSQGSVEFQNVVLVYRPGLPNALDGVTFRVRPGEKLGIVGRTGSGKSSLLLVLFRLLEPSSGRVLLDGMDTSQLELAELRCGGVRRGDTATGRERKAQPGRLYINTAARVDQVVRQRVGQAG